MECQRHSQFSTEWHTTQQGIVSPFTDYTALERKLKSLFDICFGQTVQQRPET